MKRASALIKGEKILIQGYSETSSGVWIAHGPVYVAHENQPDQIGQYIRDAIHQSTRGVPHPGPTEWKVIQAPMLEAAGARTWASLAKDSKAVGLEYDGEVVTMTPSSNYKNDGGADIPDRAFKSVLSAENIGAQLLEAFSACT